MATILYKYMSFDAAHKLFDSCSIGFSQPEYFNDPFDLPSYPKEEYERPVENKLASLHIMGKNYIWAKNTGILSLTRTPTNPLMWAHYADHHRGVVIGIDVQIARLTSEKSNLIPAQYGNVIYVSRRPDQPFIGTPSSGLAVGATHHFPHEHFEKLQRLFLHKPICWSYEEEVRVVKCLKGISPTNGTSLSGEFVVTNVEERPLYLFKVPPESICELYFGFRTDTKVTDTLSSQLKSKFAHLQQYECVLDSGSLAVEFQEYTS